MTIIDKAKIFMDIAHRGQTRWDGTTPYSTHPLRVMEIVKQLFPNSSDDTLCAALLHDTVEDTDVTINLINEKFNETIGTLVSELTFPQGCGYEDYIENCKTMSYEASIIKLADIIANIEDGKKSHTFLEKRMSAILPLIQKTSNVQSPKLEEKIIDLDREFTKCFLEGQSIKRDNTIWIEQNKQLKEKLETVLKITTEDALKLNDPKTLSKNIKNVILGENPENKQRCNHCEGMGYLEGPDEDVACETCGGAGEITPEEKS